MDDIKRPTRPAQTSIPNQASPATSAQSLQQTQAQLPPNQPAPPLRSHLPSTSRPLSQTIRARQLNQPRTRSATASATLHDVEKYIDHTKTQDETIVPISKSAQKQALKQQNRAKKAKLTKRLIAACAIFVVLGILAFIIFHPTHREESAKLSALKLATADNFFYSPLTGLEVKDADTMNSATTCIMIENSPEARPQSGLTEAGVVYEAIAEGGITRFMAIYQESKPQLIGPVRSARLTYVHFAKSYNCSFAHVGGAGNAVGELRNSGYRDLDGGYYEGKYFFRNNGPFGGKRRSAPHNVYTNFDALDKLNYEKGFTSSKFNGFSRIEPEHTPDTTGQSAKTVRITMSSATFNPIFTYDAGSNSYRRAHANGGAHTSVNESGQQIQISPTVVAAIKVDAIARSTEKQFSDYVTTGSGDAFIFQNGTVVAGTWKRDSIDQAIQFYDRENNEILLNRGQTWISAYPSNSGSVTWE
ncbi:DUF3048 domain-containing protein [Candidatus Saccharibacteria bacterium]|nr:DUF3048 domain-containing protein [Candidatus Saccharibacteria bacterium]